MCRMKTWVLGVVLLGVGFAGAAEKPNVLLVMIDDLGWMDVGFQGNPAVETPNLDRLANEGMRFSAAYASAPVCSPTRAALMTGQSPARLHITNHIPDQARFVPEDAELLPAEMLDRLPLEKVTVAERLKEAGYATGFFGKWHLCGEWSGKFGRGDEAFHPEAQGFDVNVGGCALGGPPSFFDPYKIDKIPPRREGEYLPDRLADEVIGFMREHREEPFFVSLWNYTVHWPMEAPADLVEKYKPLEGQPGVKDARYAAMTEAMDVSLGRVFAELDALGLRDDTLVVFTSDNGAYGGVADMRPLRAAKGHLYEGGIRVPMVVRWPGVIEAGSESAVPVVSHDLYPTFLEVAGLGATPGQPLDGESLMPLLSGKGKLDREAVFFHAPNYAFHQDNRLGGAMRDGRFKLIERFDNGELELYDLDADLSEKKNLAGEMRGRAEGMRGKLKAWREEVGAAMPRKR